MAAIDTIRNLMHGEQRMCSVCEIARATGLDTEMVKPLMVQIAMEQPRKLWEAAAHIPPKRRKELFSDVEVQTIRHLWDDDVPGREIARRMDRKYGSLVHKIYIMQHTGLLQRRNTKRGTEHD